MDTCPAMPFVNFEALGGGGEAHRACSRGPSEPSEWTWTTSWDVSEMTLTARMLPGQLVGCPFSRTCLDVNNTSLDVLDMRQIAAGSRHSKRVFHVMPTWPDTSGCMGWALSAWGVQVACMACNCAPLRSIPSLPPLNPSSTSRT